MRRLVVGIFLSLVGVGLAAVMSRVGLVGPPTFAETQVAEPVARLPAHPYQKSTGDAYTRFVFGANVPGNLVVEVRTIFIKAGGKSQLPPLEGPALLEVQNGAGTLSRGEHRDAVLDPLQLIKLDMHEPVILNNTGNQPLVVQLYLFEAK